MANPYGGGEGAGYYNQQPPPPPGNSYQMYSPPNAPYNNNYNHSYPPQYGNGYEQGNGNGNNPQYQGQPPPPPVPPNKPGYSDPPPSYDEVFKVQQPKWNDLWAGILFLITCAGFVVVSAISIQGYGEFPRPNQP